MVEYAALVHYGALVITVGLAFIGAAIGQGAIGKKLIEANNLQPAAYPQLNRVSLLAMVLTETAAISTTTIIIIAIFTAPKVVTIATGLSMLGVAAASGLSSLAVSSICALPSSQALLAVARQPFFAPRIMNVLLLTLSIIQSPAIFGFLISLLIIFSISSVLSIADGWRLFAAGLSIGLGTIGPTIGQGLFARQACQSVGVNRDAYRRILSFALISQTIIETPIIFSLVIAILILGIQQPSALQIIAYIIASCIMGVSAFMPGISSGRIAATACEQFGLNQGDSGDIARTALLAQGLVDTLAIYGMLVSILLIYS